MDNFVKIISLELYEAYYSSDFFCTSLSDSFDDLLIELIDLFSEFIYSLCDKSLNLGIYVKDYFCSLFFNSRYLDFKSSKDKLFRRPSNFFKLLLVFS